MKKFLLCFIISCLSIIIFCLPSVYAYSEEFEFLLDTMGTSKVNKAGKEINEAIYNEYKLFVYGSPLDGFSGQRWKNVEDGHWTKGGGAWSGSGTRGEYWILGTNYDNNEVHNHKFPVDIEPPTSPTKWRYAVVPGARESWENNEKVVDDIQKEYLLSQKLMRNDVVYDIKAEDIGLDKIRVENYPTWKTKGTLYTQRYDMNNKKWAANFMVPPMAGEASLDGYAIFPLGLEISLKENSSVSMPIIFGAQVLNLTEYAKEEHVKEIKSELYINGKLIDVVKNNSVFEISKETIYNVDKNEHANSAMIILNVKVKSTLFTTFTTDGALTDIKEYTVYVYTGDIPEKESESVINRVFDERDRYFEEIPPPEITSIKVFRIENGQEKELLTSKKTGEKFICAGQTIVFKVKAINGPQSVTLEFAGDASISTFDNLTKLFEWDEPRKRNSKTMFGSLKAYEKMYCSIKTMTMSASYSDEKEFSYTYVVPYKTKQTLHSWSTLREISKDAFNIDESRLFSRISNPYAAVFKVSGPTGKDTKRISLDVFERWDTLYNRDLSKYVK